MLIEKVFIEAEHELRTCKISEVVIGLTITAVQLNNGNIGTSLVLLEELTNCSDVSFEPDEFKNMEAIEVARWAIDPKEHVLKRILGLATINACARSQNLSAAEEVDISSFVHLSSKDTVGVIGWMRKLVSDIEHKVGKMIVFDNSVKEYVYPPERQEELLPTCDVVFITGTSFINHSIDQLLSLCQNARQIIITGPTTPMFPNAYRDTNVKVIAGGIWKPECKEEIFARISLNAGVPRLSRYMDKISLKIN